MSLTARQLNRATLGRQLLLDRAPLAVVDAIRRVVALQAQEAASPYLAIWNRIARFDPVDLDAAFADRSVVKASLMRITLHAVSAEDYLPFHEAMVSILRASRLGDGRFTGSGLSTADADALIPDLLEFAAEPRSKAEIEARLGSQLRMRLGSRLGAPNPWAWWALRTFARLHHAPTGGPWSFGSRPSFVAADARPPVPAPGEAVRHLVRRYLDGFGPASIRDIGQFTLIRVPVIRQAIAESGDDVVALEGPSGSELYDVPGGLLPPEDALAQPRLMPMWDSVLLAYADRSRLLPPEFRRLVIRQNGDVLPTLLVDGFVAGVWRPVDRGIEATAFHPLTADVWRGLAAEAARLVEFLADRDPSVYRRYGHWWSRLPEAEVRLLPG